MADTEITWRGLTLGGDSSYVIQSITGWDDLADLNDMSQARVRGHGDHVGGLYSQARIVTVTGKIVSASARNALAQALARVSTVRSALDDLTIETLGQALTTQARVVRRSLAVGETYGVGEVPFSLQFRCPDPLRYGPAKTATTGLPTSGGGLTYPLTYPLDYGTSGATGQLRLDNAGDADAAIVFGVVGGATYGLPQGWEVSAAGQRITYPTAVPPRQTITVDTAAGTVLAEGTADRRGALTNADWLLVPAGGSLTVQFTSLGGTYDPGTLLTATWKDAVW
jgi:hypothetical protein